MECGSNAPAFAYRSHSSQPIHLSRLFGGKAAAELPHSKVASRTQVDRLLNPKSDITLSSLQRAAAMVGRRVMIELV
jgi:hypothetical protein